MKLFVAQCPVVAFKKDPTLYGLLGFNSRRHKVILVFSMKQSLKSTALIRLLLAEFQLESTKKMCT